MHERMMDKTSQPSDTDMINTIEQTIAVAWTALQRFLVETYDIVPTDAPFGSAPVSQTVGVHS